MEGDSRPQPEDPAPGPAGAEGPDPERVLDGALRWARSRGYAGHSSLDALESPVLRACLGWSRPGRLLANRLVLNSPFNLRGILGVPRTRNPQGLALFAGAYLHRYQWSGDPADRLEAEGLLGRLCEGGSRSYGGIGWGYPHRWQDAGFYVPAGFPNRVVTSFVAEALLLGHRALGEGRYLEAAVRAAEFLLNAPRLLYHDGRSMCLSTVPLPNLRWRALAAPALAARVLVQVAAQAGLPPLGEAAAKLLRFVVEHQTPEGAWYDADPPPSTHPRPSGLTTGVILHALMVYAEETGSDEFLPACQAGLRFYREESFEPEGAPRLQAGRGVLTDPDGPGEAQAAAQGIITLEAAGGDDPQNRELADRIVTFAFSKLWHGGDGRFFTRRPGSSTRGFTLMHSSQSWLCFALAFRKSARRVPTLACADGAGEEET